MDSFFVIQVILKNGQRGFLFDSPDGIKISVGAITGDATQFTTYEEATDFIRKRKIEKSGARAYAKSIEAIIQEKTEGLKIVAPDMELFFVENELGEKLFYDSKTGRYFFKNGEVGFPCWNKRKELEASLNQFDFPFQVFIKTMPKNK